MSNGEDIKKKLTENSEKIDTLIEEILTPRKPEELYNASFHLIKAGGKRLRPFLTVKACELVGGSYDEALPFAAAMEMLHNFTLVHDDIMDNDPLRRGAPTVHAKWGVPVAIAAGDLLFAVVYETMTARASPKLNCKRLKRCIELATQASIEICKGQFLDISFPSTVNVSEDDYLYMVGGKTSALFKACAEIGAIVGGGTSSQSLALGKFAWDAGMAFQIIDDYLGATADEKTLGKPVGSDIREGKKTLIIIHALKHANARQKERILSVLGNHNATRSELDDMNLLLKRIGSLDYALRKADRYTKNAKKRLNKFGDSEAKQDLLELVDYFTNRTY